MAREFSAGRLSDLLVNLREDLDVEIKNWLDLRNDNNHKATFAKAALALANHGGGYIVLGMQENPQGAIEAPGRPPTFDAYDQDLINGIIHNYADPAFHCAVHIVASQDGNQYPIVVVPGNQKVPVRAKRAGPNGNIVDANATYIRKPGPRSEVPTSSNEWDSLLARCLANRRDEMFDQIRGLITGALPQTNLPPQVPRLDEWIERNVNRWRGLVQPLPPDDGVRCPKGHHWFAYEIEGAYRAIPPAQFPQAIRDSVVRHTGWPPFWYPTPPQFAPYPIDGLVECWIGREEGERADRQPAHSDFWRIAPNGLAFLLRGYQEDSGEVMRGRPIDPGTLFDITLPVWRVGEVLLHAASLSRHISEGPASINIAIRYEGLAGRRLTSLSGNRMMWGDRVATQNEITVRTRVEVESIAPNLPEIVRPLLEPLYALFDFFELPMALVVEELTRMRAGRF